MSDPFGEFRAASQGLVAAIRDTREYRLLERFVAWLERKLTRG